MSDDARTHDETIPMVIEPTGQVTKLTTNRAMELLGDQAVEIDRLRARVAELETAGADMDDVLSAMMIENACRDLSLRDRTTLARGSWARAVRGER